MVQLDKRYLDLASIDEWQDPDTIMLEVPSDLRPNISAKNGSKHPT
jgi:hypothetical protein